MTKNIFKNLHYKNNIRLDHLSDRQLDYIFLEYKLYLILYNYPDYDFSVLGLTKNIDIIIEPNSDDYNIYKRTHVTLNAELYKLYECGYFSSNESFISYVTIIIDNYVTRNVTIKSLVNVIRKTRLDFTK
ncbi:hypothetical protein [Romboutsia lituseburensis]|uniref:hypothetical protein n=1 Tax=Romboutsia lituseburensis TaxID=1537 RepID=UPI0022EA4F0A|nr:hypothetical protein [Romboutsia lituseburensis]